MEIYTPNYGIGIKKSNGDIVSFIIAFRYGNVEWDGGYGEISWYIEGGREIFSPALWDSVFFCGGPAGKYIPMHNKKRYKLNPLDFIELLAHSNEEVSKQDMRFIYRKLKERTGRWLW
jgi:hypothetical protein